MTDKLMQAQLLSDIWNQWKNESRGRNNQNLKFNQNAQKFWYEGIRLGFELSAEQSTDPNEKSAHQTAI